MTTSRDKKSAETGDAASESQARKNGQHPAEVIEPIAYRPARDSGSESRFRFRLLPTAMASVFAVLAVLAWYMFTARAVTLEFEPLPDTLDIDGGFLKVELGGRHLLRPGSYRLTAEKEGYHLFEADLEVTRESSQEYGYTLKKLPGFLAVHSRPVDGATVTIDGFDVGTTPLTGLEVEPGPHQVTIRAEKYLEFQTDFEIEGMRREQALEGQLEPAWGDITIASTPEGATLLVDGKEEGKTPLVAQIVRGNRELELVLPGYKVWRGDINVVQGEAQTLPGVFLEKADGLLSVVTRPSGVNVTVNGRYRGQSPVQVALTPGRTYRIGLSRSGYKPATRAVTVTSNQQQTLRVDLSANLGVVRVDARPADATVLVNGQPRGNADQVLTLPASPQTIEIRKDGFATYTTTVTPRPGFDQRISVTLKTIEQARLDALKDIERTTLGQELKLVRPGRFTMGASRREQGRRSNESLREIELTQHFYISTRPVTNAEFRQFLRSHSSGDVMGQSLNQAQHPVVNVTWDQAARFCNWLSARESLPPAYEDRGGKMHATAPLGAGYRLPTEAEWSWAGRFAAGAQSTRFPWGDTMPPDDNSGNYADLSAQTLVATIIPDYQDRFEATSPVGRFNPNSLGLYDVGGNAAEWMHDYYSGGAVTSGRVETDPTGPDTGDYHVIRGSSWRHATLVNLRLSFRDYSDEARSDVGFRVARYAD